MYIVMIIEIIIAMIIHLAGPNSRKYVKRKNVCVVSDDINMRRPSG